MNFKLLTSFSLITSSREYSQEGLVGRLFQQIQENQWDPGGKDKVFRLKRFGGKKGRTMQNSNIFLRLWNNDLLKLTGAPCVPLPPFSPATPTGPCQQNIIRHALQCSMLAQRETIKVELLNSESIVNGFLRAITAKLATLSKQ